MTDKKKAAREAAKRYRERQKGLRQGGASRPADAVSSSRPPTPVDTSKEEAKAKAKRIEQIGNALGGTVEALAEGAQMLWLDSSDPHFGHERSMTIGELWAPVLEPYLAAHPEAFFATILATGGTAAMGLQWAHELREKRARYPKAT